MNKLLSIASLAALMVGVSAGAASALPKINYVEGSAGVTTQDELKWGGGTYDMDQGENFAISVGTTSGNWDTELEFSYDKMEYSCCSPNNVHEHRLMLNGTYNFDMDGPITPYLGAGVGVAWAAYENPSYETKDTVPAGQLIAGARWAVNEQWSLFGEYRFQRNFSDPEDQGLKWEHGGNNFAVGVRINFQ